MERRDHDRRIDDIDLKLCTHLKETEGIVGNVNEMKNDIKEVKELLQNMDFESLKSVSEVFNGAVSFKKFVIGLASVFISMSAIGAGIVWLIKQAVK
jgi:hypothetical protein